MSLHDRRRHPRFPFHSRGSLVIDGELHPGTLLDISACGCLFAADGGIRIPVGRDCRVLVRHAPRRDLPSFGGILAHCHDHLLGIEFVDISDDAHDALHQIVEMNLAPVRLLERQLPALLRQQINPAPDRTRPGT
jgi:hypothetical protein